MENPTIIDLDGNTIEVKDLTKCIAEAETYVYMFEANGNKNMLKHWKHILDELKKIEKDLVD